VNIIAWTATGYILEGETHTNLQATRAAFRAFGTELH